MYVCTYTAGIFSLNTMTNPPKTETELKKQNIYDIYNYKDRNNHL